MTRDGRVWHFEMSTSREDGATVVALAGRLGAAATARAADGIARILQSGDRHVVLDLHALEYISSAGILAIGAAAARARGDGGSLEIRGADGAVKIALDLAGMGIGATDRRP